MTLSPTVPAAPVDHNVYDPACYGCGFRGSGACSTVCAACGCHWSILEIGEPNIRRESCDHDGCECHTDAFADRLIAEYAEDGMEAAWRDAGYASSFAVYQQEGR